MGPTVRLVNSIPYIRFTFKTILTLDNLNSMKLLTPQNWKNLFRPLNHFRLSRDIRTFPKYVLEPHESLKKMAKIFFQVANFFYFLFWFVKKGPGLLGLTHCDPDVKFLFTFYLQNDH